MGHLGLPGRAPAQEETETERREPTSPVTRHGRQSPTQPNTRGGPADPKVYQRMATSATNFEKEYIFEVLDGARFHQRLSSALSPDVSPLSLAPPRALAAALAVRWVWEGLLHHLQVSPDVMQSHGEILHLIAQTWGWSQCGTGVDSYS